MSLPLSRCKTTLSCLYLLLYVFVSYPIMHTHISITKLVHSSHKKLGSAKQPYCLTIGIFLQSQS